MGEKEREVISFPEEYETADGARWSDSDSVRFGLVVLRCRILSTTMNQFIDLLVARYSSSSSVSPSSATAATFGIRLKGFLAAFLAPAVAAWLSASVWGVPPGFLERQKPCSRFCMWSGNGAPRALWSLPVGQVSYLRMHLPP